MTRLCALCGALAVLTTSVLAGAQSEQPEDRAGENTRSRSRSEEGAGRGEATDFPVLHDDGRPSQERDALVLVVEGLEGVIRPASLRVRLSGVFGRPVVALSDPEAENARATLWIAADDKQLTLRLSTPPRADLWRRIPRAQLGADAAAIIINALLDMLWSERMRPADEMRDPFCPPGMDCTQGREASARRAEEQNVLDPWDSYQRFDRDARASGRGERWDEARMAPGSAGGASSSVQVGATSQPAPIRPLQQWALAALVGGGVHKAGGFLRYEVNALRRFERFDVGLTFVGGRGQPSVAHARRAVAALFQVRFPLDGLEIDVGGSFGLFVAERSRSAEVAPYLRALGAFAIDTHTPVAVLIQSELGTTFTSVGSTGPVEYALTLGLRYGF